MSHSHRRRFLLTGIIHKKKKKMDSSISSSFRNKFWVVFFALFVFWYLLLYGFDWSSFPGLTSLPFHHQEKPIQSIIPAETIHVTNHHQTGEEGEEKAFVGGDSGNSTFSVDNNSGNNSSNVDDDDVVVYNDNKTERGAPEEDMIDDVEDLEKELEPLLVKDDPKYGLSETEDDGEHESCKGRYIYVHELPGRFNEDLVKECKSLNQWSDMCRYLVNNGLGADLGNPGRIFSRTCWFNTNQFSLEVIFHNRMKQYDCLTNDSSKAAAVFVPYYAGLDVSRHLWGSNAARRDADSLDLVKWLRRRPEWDAMSGRDHFMVAGRITWDFRRGVDEDSSWGNKLMLLPETKNMTLLTIESSPWNSNDFAIPYPTYFHPWNDNDVVQWQNRMRKLKRKSLFCFAGGPRPDRPESIRGQVMDQCRAKRKCSLIECTNNRNRCQKPEQVMKMFQNSVFCLQPPGDSFTRRSTFDSLLAGCIPVFFTPASAYVQYLWHLPKDYRKYSVLIPEDEVKNKGVSIENVLSRIPRSRVAAMREEVIKLIPKVVYADPRSRLKTLEDAFDLTVKGVIQRVESLRKEMKEGKNISSLSVDEEKSWKYYAFGTTRRHEWDHFFVRKEKAMY